MSQYLGHIKQLPIVSLGLPSSKSESNRLLILQALSKGELAIENLSTANDTVVLKRCLESSSLTLDVADAGTAMRFLLAYCCAEGRHTILKGTDRMHERPIGDLVDALRSLGFRIDYLNKNGFPPLEVLPVNLASLQDTTEINGAISSQYLSALMLIGWQLPNGIAIHLKSELISRPYMELTVSLMRAVGLELIVNEQNIEIAHQRISSQNIKVGVDWTNASYWYAFVALSENATILIEGLNTESSQGDKILMDWMLRFGVVSTFKKGLLQLTKVSNPHTDDLYFDFTHHPDLAQTIIVLCAGLNRNASFEGMASLKIKETNRIDALNNELQKFGVSLLESNLGKYTLAGKFVPSHQTITTYHDHRMAMAFAPLAMLTAISIDAPEVVAKSFPSFWDEMAKFYD
jgi:3-phosphoshikimate 1-carboxyvinyltransferase